MRIRYYSLFPNVTKFFHSDAFRSIHTYFYQDRFFKIESSKGFSIFKLSFLLTRSMINSKEHYCRKVWSSYDPNFMTKYSQGPFQTVFQIFAKSLLPTSHSRKIDTVKAQSTLVTILLISCESGII